LTGILWAADHGANVANMSLGGSFPSTGNGDIIDVINAVFGYARSRNMTVVVSAGNESTNLDANGDTFAAFCDADLGICVSAVGPARAKQNPDQAAFYTNFGAQSVDVAAPGGNADFPKFHTSKWPWGTDIASWVWSRCSRQELVFETNGTPHPDGCGTLFNYNGFIGTSQASPHVTGLAALIVADNPNANPEAIKQRIEDSGETIDPNLGKSRINVRKALGVR
jgi:subtilisin family serine protease